MSIITSSINLDQAIQSGVLGSRPTAAIAGRLYLATDSGLYRDNGGSWDLCIPNQTITSKMISLTESTLDVTTDESTSSNSYVDLTTSGPAITLSPTITQIHYIFYSGDIYNSVNTSRGAMSISVNGASATDTNGILISSPGGNNITSSKFIIAASQTSGNTHTSKYRAVENTMNARQRRIFGFAG